MSKRILVVEDQEDLRAILRDLLTASDFEVIEAADGRAGVEKARASGCDGYVTKPYSPMQLLRMIRGFLPDKG